MAKQNLASGRKNILITGVAGFIGTNLAERMVKDYNVIGLDNFITGSQKNIDLLLQNANFEFIRQDITQPFDLTSYPELKKFQIPVQGIQEVYHLACPTSPRDHEQYAMQILSANSYGIKNVLDVALKHKSIFVHASSQHIYGAPKNSKPIPEDYFGTVNPIGPRSAYDEGKRFAETMVYHYQSKHKLNTKIARIFTTYGPKMQINDGRSVPDFIINALDNKELVVHGDQKTENTFCYIDDMVDALVKLAKSSLNQPINIGHYEKYKLKDVAELVIKLTESKSTITYQEPEWHSTSYNIPDIKQAKEKLGWFPLIDLEQGMKKTIEFTRANIRLYQV